MSPQETIKCEHPNVTLREWKIEDAQVLSAIINNKNVWDNLDDLPFPYTLKNYEDFIRLLLLEKEQKISYAICYDDKVVGWIGVFRKENIRRLSGELGYYIAEEHWGKGITTAAVKRICKYIFEHTGIIRILAEVFAFNTASCRVLEKTGFAFEGIMRQNAIKNNQIVDLHLYAKLKTD